MQWDLQRVYYKIAVSGKIKISDKKVKENKAQCNLDRKTADVVALSSGNVGSLKQIRIF